MVVPPTQVATPDTAMHGVELQKQQQQQQLSEQAQFTTFGFLNEEDDPRESLFGIGSILSRVRNAFVPQDVVLDEPETAATQPQSQTGSGSATEAATSAVASTSKVTSAIQSLEGLGGVKKPIVDQQRKWSKTSQATPAHSNRTQFESTQEGANQVRGSNKGPLAPQVSSRGSRPSSSKNKLPFSLSSTRQAPAVTSTTAAHAVSRNHLNAFEDLDEHSVAADDGELEDGEDVLTSLMRKSGVDPSRGHMGRYSAVPGFPLPKDLLNDDSRSIHSASSRRPRSEVNSTSEAHYAVTHSQSHLRRQSKAGLGTSAEAFRRMRGEGAVLSKAFWMPDENVKECRECQSYFTPFRRKHHCRICGLVYCSRCASNIIPGSRFGLDGAEIRVCNFCLRMLSEYERAGLRSSTSAVSLNTSPQRVATSYARKRTESSGLANKPDKGMISGPLEAQLTHPQAQFAANHLFAYPRSGLSKGLTRMDSLQDLLNDADSSSRPQTPMADMLEAVNTGVDENAQQDEPVPFRSKLSEEDGVVMGDDEAAHFTLADNSPDTSMTIAKPEQLAIGKDVIKFPSMPITSSSTIDDETASLRSVRIREARTKRLNEPVSTSDGRHRLVGDAAIKAYRRSKLRAREGSGAEDENRTMTRAFASGTPFLARGKVKRNSFTGVFLTGMPSNEELSEISRAHLGKMLAQSLSKAGIPDRKQWQRTLEPLLLSIVRKIHPNPKFGESMDIRQYIKIKRVAGGAITDSNYVDGFILSKQVATKKMARSLPLSNPRVMVVTFAVDFHRAEGQFMSLEPLLAQEHEYTRILVARILQLRPNILVVKETVSRLALDLLEDAGVVVVWSVKMSAVQAISRCCQADMISSIDRLALEPRLGRCVSFNIETFQHAHSPNSRKSMMRFLTSGSAQSLGCTITLRGNTLETLGKVKQVVSLLAFVAHNLRLEEQLDRNEGAQTNSTTSAISMQPPPVLRRGSCGAGCERNSDELTSQIEQALKPYEETLMSASASIVIPPPHPLVTMKQSHDKVRMLQQECSCEQGKDAEQQVGIDDGNETPTADRKALALPTLVEAMPKPSETQALYAQALLEHDMYLKEWRSCIDLDQMASIERLSVLWALMSSATQKPCMGPLLLSWQFYGTGDESLGHFLERTCNESSTICPAKGCGRPRGVHYSSFVHNETRVQVVQERFVCPIPGQENRLLMWSYCKKCEQATPVTPVSDDTWSFSFAKYLELHFYAVNKTTTLCGHDYYADFVRFFSLQNLAIRFHRDRDFTVREVILPPLRILPQPNVDYRLKVEGAKLLQEKMNAYWTSVTDRIAAIRKEPHLSSQHITQLETSTQTAKQDEVDLYACLINTCQNSDQTDVLALNIVRNKMQAAVVRWDQFFQEIEKSALPSERDVRRLTSHHLSRLFQEKGGELSLGMDRHMDPLALEPAAEVDEGGALSASASECTSPTQQTNLLAEGLSTSQSTPQLLAEAEETGASSATSPSMSSPALPQQRRSNTIQDVGQSASPDAAIRKTDGTDSDTQSIARPPLRRGKTTEAVSGRRGKGTMQKPQQPSTGPAGPSGRRSTAIPRRGPPSSYRPPKVNPSSGLETESDTGATSSSSVAPLPPHQRRKASSGQRRGRTIGGGPSSALSDDSLVHGQIRPPSRVPVAVRSSKVSTIARRFDNLQKEAERERDKQKHVLAMRARRARPVAASQATVQVYRNVKEAVRDEDDDESDSPASNDEGEAEDEDEEVSDVRKGDTLASSRRMLHSPDTERDAKPVLSAAKALDTLLAPREDSSPERERDKESNAMVDVPPPAALPSRASSSLLDGTHEAAAAEVTVSSLLSGTLPASWRASLLSDGDTQDGRGSLLKTLSSLWGRGNAHLPLIDLPMSSNEHLFSDSPWIVLREDEPSSLIAFTLHSSTYASRLQSLREAQSKTDATTPTGEKKVNKLELHSRERLESVLRQSEGTHLSFQFSSGDSRFSIRVLFTEQFDALRQACQCGQTFIQSLARCSNWLDCSGGKSGAVMMKTLDDRFIIKQLSRAEMDAFASNAGAYFRFLADVLFQDRPTTLAKIYGVYRLTIRNAHTGKSIKLDCAITENVFANAGKMHAVYDLKGALRNRFVQPNGQASQVLQDGNLVAAKVPIFLREHAKRRLREALYHDSLFLANCEVMDYSLVVGVSAEAAEIRVGIIDFIRTFTRGKKLESLFKEAVGGGLDEFRPTIIDPVQYRIRFLAFLDSVLLLSPDHWLSTKEKAGMDKTRHPSLLNQA